MYEESLGEIRERIAFLLQIFESVLDTQDEKKVKKAAEDLKNSLDELERRFEL
jgi:molecular chaperone HscC